MTPNVLVTLFFLSFRTAGASSSPASDPYFTYYEKFDRARPPEPHQVHAGISAVPDGTTDGASSNSMVALTDVVKGIPQGMLDGRAAVEQWLREAGERIQQNNNQGEGGVAFPPPSIRQWAANATQTVPTKLRQKWAGVVDGLKLQVDRVRSQLRSFQDQMGQLKYNLRAQFAERNLIQDQVANLRTQVRHLQVQIGNLKSQVMENELVQSQVHNLQSQIGNLQTQLGRIVNSERVRWATDTGDAVRNQVGGWFDRVRTRIRRDGRRESSTSTFGAQPDVEYVVCTTPGLHYGKRMPKHECSPLEQIPIRKRSFSADSEKATAWAAERSQRLTRWTKTNSQSASSWIGKNGQVLLESLARWAGRVVNAAREARQNIRSQLYDNRERLFSLKERLADSTMRLKEGVEDQFFEASTRAQALKLNLQGRAQLLAEKGMTELTERVTQPLAENGRGLAGTVAQRVGAMDRNFGQNLDELRFRASEVGHQAGALATETASVIGEHAVKTGYQAQHLGGKIEEGMKEAGESLAHSLRKAAEKGASAAESLGRQVSHNAGSVRQSADHIAMQLQHNVGDFEAQVRQNFDTFGAQARQNAGDLKTQVRQTVDGLGGQVKQSIDDVGQNVGGLGGHVWDSLGVVGSKIRHGVDSVSQGSENLGHRILEDFDGLGSRITQGVAGGVAGSISVGQKATRSVVEGVSQRVEEVAKTVGGRTAKNLDTYSDRMVQNLGHITQDVGGIGEGLVRGVGGIGEGLAKGVGGAGEGLAKGVGGAGEGLARNIDSVGRSTGRMVDDVGRGVQDLGLQARRGVLDLGDKARQLLPSQLPISRQSFAETEARTISPVADEVETLNEEMINYLQELNEKVKKNMHELDEKIKENIKWAETTNDMPRQQAALKANLNRLQDEFERNERRIYAVFERQYRTTAQSFYDKQYNNANRMRSMALKRSEEDDKANSRYAGKKRITYHTLNPIDADRFASAAVMGAGLHQILYRATGALAYYTNRTARATSQRQKAQKRSSEERATSAPPKLNQPPLGMDMGVHSSVAAPSAPQLAPRTASADVPDQSSEEELDGEAKPMQTLAPARKSRVFTLWRSSSESAVASRPTESKTIGLKKEGCEDEDDLPSAKYTPPRAVHKKPASSKKTSTQADDELDPDKEPFDISFRSMLRGMARAFRRNSNSDSEERPQVSLGRGSTTSSATASRTTNSATQSFSSSGDSQAKLNNVKLLKPSQTEVIFVAVPPNYMNPSAWRNMSSDALRRGANSASNMMVPLSDAHSHETMGMGVSMGGMAFSGDAKQTGTPLNDWTEEELVAELRRIAEKFTEGLPGSPRQAIRVAVDKALDRMKGLPKDKFMMELRMALTRLRGANAFRSLKQSAWLHSERIIREGQMLSAELSSGPGMNNWRQNSGTAAVGGGTAGKLPPLPRITPRTLRERFASNVVSLLHPWLPLEMRSDLEVQRRSSWIPQPCLWLLLRGLVIPLLWVKIGFILLKRRMIMMIFGSAVMLLPSLPLPLAIVFVRFLFDLFGMGPSDS